ncbi:hypothetical protein [Streptomyces sp. NPDC088246]
MREFLTSMELFLPSQGTEMTLSSVTAMEAYVESDEVAAVMSAASE